MEDVSTWFKIDLISFPNGFFKAIKSGWYISLTNLIDVISLSVPRTLRASLKKFSCKLP